MSSTNGSEPVGPDPRTAPNLKHPEVLAAEIERTREDLAQTLDAIADRVSPKRVADRTRKNIAEAVAIAKERATVAVAGAKDKAAVVTADVKDKAAVVTADVKDKAAVVTADVKDRAAVVTADVKDRAAGVTADVKDKAADVKDRAAVVTADVKHKAADVKDRAAVVTADVKGKVAGGPGQHSAVQGGSVAVPVGPADPLDSAETGGPVAGRAGGVTSSAPKPEVLAGGALGLLVLLLLRRRRTKRKALRTGAVAALAGAGAELRSDFDKARRKGRKKARSRG